MNKRMYRKPNMPGLSRLLRRGVALALAFSMTLPMAAQAASSVPVSATLATQVKAAEAAGTFPTIEIQTNFVRTEYGTLTGTMELALRVGPAPNGTPVTFQALATTLQFNTALFTPTDWTWTADPSLEAADQQHPIALGGQPQYYQVQLPAMKDDTQAATGAIAQCGIVDPASTDMSTNVADGSQALLFFKAECYNTTLTLDKMTTLAVIRFQVNPTLMNHLSIDRDPAKPTEFLLYSDLLPKIDTDGDGTPDSPATVTGTAQLNTAANTLAKNPVTGETAITLPATDFTAVGFALDGDTFYSESDAGRALHYTTGANQYYFVPGDVLGNTAAPLAADELNVTMKGHTYSLTVPQTLNKMVLAQDPALADGTDGKYSYTSNLIPAANITFPVVSQMSFADRGDGRGNMATILFYDWDDALIGALVVPRNDDARALVNEYVRDKMVHPALRYSQGGEPDTSTNKNLITSLSRANSYRGKYPTTPMSEAAGAADASVDLTGTKYPLTNKLDYVFLKRPMEKDETAVDADGNPTNTWKQQGTATTAEWDDKYPYIHGWALIPEEDKDWTNTTYTHPKNLWTTIGMGELSDYNGAYEGGYNNMAGAPAQLTIEGQEFTFADFDFHNNPQEKGTVYAVKAVYEPGESLLDSNYSYRMISEPYYDKLNARAAAGGGAYTVDLVFERSNTTYNTVQGVGRARELALRMETTSDIRWEDRDLLNATTTEQNAKAKTTYSNVPVDNVDEVAIQLVLSARMNKVDYYLMEAYGYNFVAGGERSGANSTFTGTAHVIDNYNYLVDGDDLSEIDKSDLTDIYYDVLYNYEYNSATGEVIATNDDRDGSHGFVLYGTLNEIVRITSQYKMGTATEAQFSDAVAAENLQDINLRQPNQEFASTVSELITMTNAIQDAAQQAVDAHQGYHVEADGTHTPVPQSDEWWDLDNGWAHLTYHQLQHFVIDYINIQDGKASGKATLRSEAAADAETVQWCNLHELCAATRAGRPTSLKAMVEAAVNAATPDDAVSKIMNMKLEVAQSFIYLKNAAKEEYTSIGDYARDFVAAVRGLNALSTINTNDPNLLTNNWDAIQGWILADTAPTSKAAAQQVSYDGAWWYDSDLGCGSADALAPAMSLTGLLGAAQKANELTRDAWLNEFRDAYRGAFEQTPPSVRDWVNYTGNLMAGCDVAGTDPTYDVTPFASFDAFKTAIKNVQTNLTVDSGWDTQRLWQEIQFYLINSRASTGSTADQEQIGNYWWYNGGTRVTDVLSMLTNARENSDTWKSFAFGDLYKFKTLHFRKDFGGTEYTATDFSDFKTRIQALAARGTGYTWEQVQYYLIHGSMGTFEEYSGEEIYYWWKDGKEGESVDFSKVVDYSSGLTAILDAAFRFEINKNVHAWDGLNHTWNDVTNTWDLDEAKGLDSIKAARFIANDNGASAFSSLGHFTSVSGFLTNISGLAGVAGGQAAGPDESGVRVNATMPVATWAQVQFYLIHQSLPSTEEHEQEIAGYWWRDADDKSSAKDKPEDYWYEFQDAFQKMIDGDGTDLSKWLGNKDNLNAIFLNLNDMENGFDQSTADYYATDAAAMLQDVVVNGAYSGAKDISWYQVEYALIGGGYSGMTDAEVAAMFVNDMGVTIPDWVMTMYPVSFSLRFTQARQLFARRPNTQIDTDPETGITTVTTTVTTALEDGTTLRVETVTLRDPVNDTLSTTTVTTLLDPEGNILTQTVSEPVTVPQEPVCTCGTETDEHAEDCPLYVKPEGLVCTCGTETDEHTENCPLYVKPEEPVCTCGSETDEHGSDCPLYVKPEEPVCTCGSEDGVHTEDCPLYTAPEEILTPEEPPKAEMVCTCGSETDEHAEDCPLYVAPAEPEEPVCTCDSVDGVHTEGCPLYVKPEEPVCTCDSADGVHTEGCPLYVKPEEPVCTCDSVDGVHTEGCPLYVKPEEPVCTCDSADGVHAEDCPLYVAPEDPQPDPEPTPEEDLPLVSSRAALARRRAVTTNITRLNGPVISIEKLSSPDPGGTPVPRTGLLAWALQMTTLVNILERGLTV